VATTDDGHFYGFNRKGEQRIPKTAVSSSISHPVYIDTEPASPEFLTTDTNGVVHRIGTAGKVESTRIDTFSGEHYFAYKNVSGDEAKEYIFVDGQHLQVYDQQYQLVYSYVFEQPIQRAPVFLRLPGQNSRTYRLGVVDEHSQKIYLFNEDGVLYPHFPLEGATSFDINDIYGQDTPYCVVGGTDNTILIYKLEQAS
jgi:hypothetical protein